MSFDDQPDPDYEERMASLRRLFILTAISMGTIALLFSRSCAGA